MSDLEGTYIEIGTTTTTIDVDHYNNSSRYVLGLGSLEGDVYISVLYDLFLGDGTDGKFFPYYESRLANATIYQQAVRIFDKGPPEIYYIPWDSLEAKEDELLLIQNPNILIPDGGGPLLFLGKEVHFLPGSIVDLEFPESVLGEDRKVVQKNYTGTYFIELELSDFDQQELIDIYNSSYTGTDRVLIAFGNPTGQRAYSWGAQWLNYVSLSENQEPLPHPSPGDDIEEITPTDTDEATTLPLNGIKIDPVTGNWSFSVNGGLNSMETTSDIYNDYVDSGLTLEQATNATVSELIRDMALTVATVAGQSLSNSEFKAQFLGAISQIAASYDLYKTMDNGVGSFLSHMQKGFDAVSDNGATFDLANFENQTTDNANGLGLNLLLGQIPVIGPVLRAILEPMRVKFAHSDINLEVEYVKADDISIERLPDGHADRYIGSSFADFADLGDGNDGAVGGAGNDKLYGGKGTDILLGGSGEDWVEGGLDSDTVFGGADTDKLFGGPGDDLLVGGLGDDQLVGGTGNDAIDGSQGVDTARYEDALADVIVSAQGGVWTVSTKTEGTDILRDVEFIEFGGITRAITSFGDNLAPSIVKVTPSDGAANVGLSSNLVLKFSEPVVRGSGVIMLSNSDGQVESLNVESSAHVTISGDTVTVDFNANLLAGTKYSVSFGSGAFKDPAGNLAPALVGYDFATQASVQPPVESRIFASSGMVVGFGGNGTVVGSGGYQNVTIYDVPGSVTFDPSFNSGGDVIRLEDPASAYTIARSGSSALISDGDTSFLVPVGRSGITIDFTDGVRKLYYDANTATVKIGSQTLSQVTAAILAPPDGSAIPTGANGSASGRLFVGPGTEIVVSGNLEIYGSAESERVSLLYDGDIWFDPSFNRGGDALQMNAFPVTFTAHRQGSSVIFENDYGTLTVPVGRNGITMDFHGEDDRVLLFDPAINAIRLGDQIIGTAPVVLTEFA